MKNQAEFDRLIEEHEKAHNSIVAIQVKAIEDMIEHIEKNKEEFQRLITVVAEADDDADSIRVRDNLDTSLLAMAVVAFEEATEKLGLFNTAAMVVGQAGQGWTFLHENWMDTRNVIKATSNDSNS